MTSGFQDQRHRSASVVRDMAAPFKSERNVTYTFPRHRRSVGRARDALRSQLSAWGLLGDTVDTATLLLSELTTNAVNARTAHGRSIAVRFDLTDTGLRLEVSDTSDEQPTLRQPANGDESGRGLLLVHALADAWGVVPRDHVGKTVWVFLETPEGAAP